MNKPTKADYLALIAKRVPDFKQFAENFGRSRFLVYESEIQAPDEGPVAYEKEVAEMEAIAQAFRCEIVQIDNRFELYFFMDDRNPGGFLEIVDAGMPAPLLGGDNGTAHNPDGSTYNSKVPYQLYGTPWPGYAKPATGVINEIRTMLATHFRTYMKEVIDASKKEILQLVKSYVAEQVQNAVKG